MNNGGKSKILVFASIVFILFFSIAQLTFAATNDTSTIDTYGNGEYAITEYHIDMNVNENNTFDMKEQITAFFNIEKHGIFRSLPLKNKVIRLDGTKHTNKATITDIDVNDSFTTYRENGNIVIKIGSADYTYTGDKSYVIKYRYNIGKDPSKDYDELYYNLIGTEWDTTISNFSFTITMPKEFDASKLGFSLGSIGSTDSTDIEYSVDGNVITGRCNRVVEPEEALTVRMELPEGYFVGTSEGNADNFGFLLFAIPVFFAIISFVLWRKYGKDDQVVDTVEFYPPEGFNSLEVGFLYKGVAKKEDVVSLLIYLANKGYIQIGEIDTHTLFSTKKSFKITKLKEYDGYNDNERRFLDGLFTCKVLNQVNGLPEVTLVDLYDSFYKTVDTIIGDMNCNRDKIIEKSDSKKSLIILLMIIAALFIITIPPLSAYGDGEVALPMIIFQFVGMTVMNLLPFSGNRSFSEIIFRLIFGFFFSVIPVASFLVPALLDDTVFLCAYIVGIICIIGMYICLNNLKKRTPYGTQILGRLRGFKKFLETAEKQKLETLVMQDPHYFYNILPYAYVLGVSNKWINKFESITLQAPDWYSGSSDFSMASFGAFMNSAMSSTTAMSSSPSSGGGSSGGGSSGGGSGGGGGGSW